LERGPRGLWFKAMGYMALSFLNPFFFFFYDSFEVLLKKKGSLRDLLFN
jgi:hypothetical protein